MVTVTTAVAVGVVVGFGVTPSVGDAPHRVAALAAVHGSGQLVTVLPVRVAVAVLAVEDHRFYHHPGIDPVALLRVGRGVLAGRDEGGATIEAQLAKLLYTGGRSDPVAQVQQVFLALKLDMAYTKSSILLMYLNTVYFGHGLYGLASASGGYFDAAPEGLDWAQAALLAGLLQAPDAFDPRNHPQAAVARRRQALDRLLATGTISAAQWAQADRQPLELAPA